jgi:hypothetical protein
VGEALVSLLDEKGRPKMVERTLIKPPKSQIGPITATQRTQMMANSLVAGVYEKVIDRESAYEILAARAQKLAEQQQAEQIELEQQKSSSKTRGRPRQSAMEAFFKSAMRSLGSTIGRKIARGLLGSLLGGK